MNHPLHKGRSLSKYPVSASEKAHREERRRELAEARFNAGTSVDAEGREWVLVRLPDCYGADVPFEEVEE